MLTLDITSGILFLQLDITSDAIITTIIGGIMQNINESFPLYCKLSEEISEKINDGTWPVGMRIPSERELVNLYNLSRITVRNAIAECVKQGKLEKIQGKGTYVINSSIVQNLKNVYSFSEEMKKQGKITSTKVLNRNIIKANDSLAKHLNVEPESEVIFIERLRYTDGNVPILIERSYFPLKGFEFLFNIDLEKKSLYKSLETDHGIFIDRAIEVFKACELNPSECKSLHCKNNQYGLLIKRTSYVGDKIVCYSTIVSKNDVFEFTIELKA